MNQNLTFFSLSKLPTHTPKPYSQLTMAQATNQLSTACTTLAAYSPLELSILHLCKCSCMSVLRAFQPATVCISGTFFFGVDSGITRKMPRQRLGMEVMVLMSWLYSVFSHRWTISSFLKKSSSQRATGVQSKFASDNCCTTLNYAHFTFLSSHSSHCWPVKLLEMLPSSMPWKIP